MPLAEVLDNDTFDPEQCSDSTGDDETTILAEVNRQEHKEVAAEVNELQRESELPLEDFLDSIPEDYLKYRQELLGSASPSSVGMCR